jgi:uncharacterized protein (DUF983 family)
MLTHCPQCKRHMGEREAIRRGEVCSRCDPDTPHGKATPFEFVILMVCYIAFLGFVAWLVSHLRWQW